MRRILLISGKAGAGKDTVGDLIVNNFKWQKLSFASTLKDEVSHIYQINRNLLDTQEGKRQNNRYDMTNRDLLISYGMAMRQKDPEYWVKKLMEKMQIVRGNVVITDFRFPNEFYKLKEVFGSNLKTMRVSRANIPQIDSITERLLDNFYFDYYIDNNTTTVDLMRQLTRIQFLH